MRTDVLARVVSRGALFNPDCIISCCCDELATHDSAHHIMYGAQQDSSDECVSLAN